MVEFVHGWGCSRKMWPHSTFDRGYFGNPQPLAPCKKLVVHSFGLHLVPKEIFEQLEELVICSGFITFVTKQRVVERMLKRFEHDPYGVLEDFLGRQVVGDIDKNLLYDDLKRLSTSIFDLNALEFVPNISIIHARNDPITPFKWGEELHQKVAQSALFPFEGGHFDSIQEAHRLGLL